MEMEIGMKRDDKDSRTYHLIINNKFMVTTTYVNQDRSHYRLLFGYDSKDRLRAWIRHIQKLHPKKIHKRILLALSAHCSHHYAHGSFKKGSCKEEPYEMLTLSVENECMVYEVGVREGIPKVLKDLFNDKRIIVMGVGIHKVAGKLQKDFGITFSKCVELRNHFPDCPVGGGAAELATAVTGGQMDYVRPKRINWWEVLERRWELYDPLYIYNRLELLSFDMMKHASVEAFLLHHVGAQLLKNTHN